MTDIAFNIICFMGKPRAGKTLSMVDYGYEVILELQTRILTLSSLKKHSALQQSRLDLYRSFEIWSNLHLNTRIFGKYRYLTADNLLQIYRNKEPIQNKILLLDDFFKKVDSRKHATEENMMYSYFFTEIGKGRNILLYVSHNDDMVEKRLREFTEFFVWCRKGYEKKLVLPSGNWFTVFEESENYYALDDENDDAMLDSMIIEQLWFRDEIEFDRELIYKKKPFDVRHIQAKKSFNRYKTGEVI